MELSGLSDKEFEGILFSRLERKGCDVSDAELFSETERRSAASGGRMTFVLGLLYHLGVGTEADQDEADRLWVESFPDAEEGLEIIANSRYCGSLGLDLRRAGDMYCRASDMGGDDVLMLRAADCYLAEYMEKKDPEAGALAFGCYRFCYPDFLDSGRGLAMCYLHGIGTDVSLDKAEDVIWDLSADGRSDYMDLLLQLREKRKQGYYFE